MWISGMVMNFVDLIELKHTVLPNRKALLLGVFLSQQHGNTTSQLLKHFSEMTSALCSQTTGKEAIFIVQNKLSRVVYSQSHHKPCWIVPLSPTRTCCSRAALPCSSLHCLIKSNFL